MVGQIHLPPPISIGGTISGLNGTLVLQNNGGGDLSLTTNGDFEFEAGLAGGATYVVTVLTQPATQVCTVSNASGSISGASVSNVLVNCVTHANPTGYYTGKVNVKDTDNSTPLDITDAHFLVNGTRIMIVSATRAIVYDGEMSITGNGFTSKLSIFKDGVKESYTANVKGDINEEIGMTATLTGDNLASGTFVADYDKTLNNEFALQDKIGPHAWLIKWNLGGADYMYIIDAVGNITSGNKIIDTSFAYCEMVTGTALKIDNTRLYKVTVTIDNCNNPPEVKGSYTGLATTNDGHTSMILGITHADKTYGFGDVAN